MTNGKNSIVGQSGGPTAVINASLAGVATAAMAAGGRVYGMQHGVQGLARGEVLALEPLLNSADAIDLLKTTPAAFLGSCRRRLPAAQDDPEAYRTLFRRLEELEIGAFYYIGGNDSMDTIQKLHDYGAAIGSPIRFVGVPKTIDNDLAVTDHTPGYGSAARYIATVMKELIADSLVYDEKRVTLVEIMGRNAGYLAMYVGLAVGATAVLVPEEQIDFERDVVEKIRKARLNGFTHYMIVVAEGAGKATDIAAKIKDATDLDPRVTVLGHIQRGGSPTGRDRVNATKMGYLAVELLLQGKTNRIVCTHDGNFTDVDIDEGLAMHKSIQQMEVDVLAAMTGI